MKINEIFNEQVRGWIYRVLLAVGALLAGFGILTNDQLTLILGVVVAVLNVMPSVNTSVKKTDTDELI